VAVHGFGIDTPRTAHASQVSEKPLNTRAERAGVFVRLREAQSFKGETRACKALRNAVFGFVIGQDDNFNASLEQRRDDIALQEVYDCHAVVGGDEDFFGHEFYGCRCEERSDETISYVIVTRDTCAWAQCRCCHATLASLETAARNDIIIMNNTN
jgi:hypothetical protein